MKKAKDMAKITDEGVDVLSAESKVVNLEKAGATTGTLGAAATPSPGAQQLLDKLKGVQGLDINVNNAKNCVNTAVAADRTLSGAPSVALSSGGAATSAKALEKLYRTKWSVEVDDLDSLAQHLIEAGPGSRAIIASAPRHQAVISSGVLADESHVFNAVNVDGTVHFVDATTLTEVVDVGLDRFRMLITFDARRP
jgi:hypothetical protein